MIAQKHPSNSSIQHSSLCQFPVAPSPKGKALHKTGKIEEAIEIWEKLVKNKIEGFSESVASALRIAKTEQVLSYARRKEASGELDFAIETLTSALLKDPDQKDIESELRSMLLKRRGVNKDNNQDSQSSQHLAEIDLNEQFLNRAEELLKKEIKNEN